MMYIFRWCFLSLMFFLLLVGCVGGVAWAQSAVTVQLKWKHQFQFAGYYVALEKGYYAAEGLDVRLIEGGMEHPPMDALLSGDAQYAVTDAGALLYRAEGKPIVVLASIFQHSPQIILTRRDSDINTPADLRGKRVMLQKGYLTVEVLSMLHHFGVTQFIRQPNSYNIKGLLEGSTDAFPAYSTNEPFLMAQQGVPFRIFRPMDYGIDFYGDTLVTTESELEHHPERAAAFRRATIKGWEYALQHTAEIVDLIQRRYNTQHKSRAHLMFEAQAISHLMPFDLIPIGFSNPVRWQRIADAFADEGLIKPSVSLQGFLYKPQIDLMQVLRHNKWKFSVIGLLVSLLLLLLYIAQSRRHVARIDAERHKLRQLVEVQPTPVVISRKDDGLVLFYNKVAMSVMGFSEEEKETRYTSDFYFNLQDRDRIIDLLHEQGGFYNVELKLKKGDGTPIWALLSAQPMVFEGEDAFYVTFIDITARRQAEIALQQSKKMEALGVLVGGIAHDFNNALAGLRVNTFILSEDESRLSDDAKQALKKNMKLISYSKDMIRKLLMAANRDETGKEVFSLTAGLNGMLDMVRMSVPEHVAINMHIPDDAMMMTGDRIQIQQLVINLVNNARDALVLVDQAHIDITTGVTTPAEDFYVRHPEAKGSYVWLRVKDNGHGIADEHIDHIFEPFFSSKSMHEGAGLGLAAVYHIVKNHRGFIEVKSQAGTGTVMTAYFPRYMEAIPYIGSEPTFPLIHGRGETILIVDDDADLLASLAVTMERIGYHTLKAGDGAQAWTTLLKHQQQISLLILDAIMPRMNGIDVVRKMRHDDIHIPVIFVTGYDFTRSLDDDSMPENCIVLSKPYDVGQLSYEMRQMMEAA